MTHHTPSTAHRLARVVLSRAAEPGDPITASLVRQLGPERALLALREPRRGSGLHQRLREVDPERELDQARRQGIRFVVPGDEEWPEWLQDLDDSDATAHGKGGMPVGLWVRGPMQLTDLRESVAVVGSRSATVYGERTAADIAATVAGAGMAVVSGAAYGIDRAAHDGALGAGGRTAAVLACGVDRAYPAGHASLLRELAARFAVVSEVPPGSAPTRLRFLSRNRLIACLTRGTVLVEAAVRSGALNTATWAEALNRPVLGIPGPVTSAPSQGVHLRIRDGGATLVTNGAEVLEAVGAAGQHLVRTPREPARPRDRLSALESRVLDAAPVERAADVVSIARTAALHVRDVDAALRRLAAGGFVVRHAQGWRLSRPAGEESCDLGS